MFPKNCHDPKWTNEHLGLFDGLLAGALSSARMLRGELTPEQLAHSLKCLVYLRNSRENLDALVPRLDGECQQRFLKWQREMAEVLEEFADVVTDQYVPIDVGEHRKNR